MKLINKSEISGGLLQEIESVIERGSDHHIFELIATRVEETGYRYCKEIQPNYWGMGDALFRNSVIWWTVPGMRCRK